ncbi:MAG: molybdate ABC transporter substrate-binding protein [Bauldia sp.]|nr:molybdate ABC transporter substrate-binding protein [Bauldia sp.]
MRRRLAGFGLGLSLIVAVGAPAVAQDNQVVVFAAASLQTALDAIGEEWTAETGNIAVISYAGSSALARQIEERAPAEIFMSADLNWMDYLAERDLIVADTRTNLLGNRIVLVAPVDSTVTVEIGPDLDLAGLLGADGRLAVADTDAVPAGVYAKAALESLGLWDDVAGRLAQTENVRAALALVSIGEAPYGIVYATDDNADPAVKALGVFPEDSHPPIVYPAAVTAEGADNPLAAAFLGYLRSVAALCIFVGEGFTVFAEDGSVAAPSCPAAE